MSDPDSEHQEKMDTMTDEELARRQRLLSIAPPEHWLLWLKGEIPVQKEQTHNGARD